MDDHGLDLSRVEVTSPSEVEAFRDFFTETVGYPLPAFEPWLELRPDVLKRYRLQVHSTPTEDNHPYPLVRFLGSLHYYVVAAYEDGIAYEIRNAQSMGATRSDVLETIALAFIDAGPRGMRYVATGALDALRAYEDPPSPSEDRWPPGWRCDPTALSAGLDYSTPTLLEGELDLIRRWHLRVAGEVPPYVELLGRFRPNLLKAHRNRFEHSIRTSLPTQAVPFLLINLGVARASAAAVREAVLMGRGLGLTLDDVTDAIAWGLMFGGTAGVAAAQEAVGDVLANWEAAPGATAGQPR